MKKITFVILILCLIPIEIISQGKMQGRIDSYCNNIDSLVGLDTDTHTAYMVHSINLETNKRAIGKQHTTIKFYYPMPLDSVIESEKGTEFIYIYKSPVKINVEYNIAASQKNVLDYYFNNKGKLVLFKYQSTGEYGCLSMRKYFQNNKLKRDVTDKLTDCNASDAMILQQNSITEVKIINNAKAYLKMFNELVKIEQLDK